MAGQIKSAIEALKTNGASIAGIPTAGFSTYGEAYLGHMNQTSAMLVFHGFS